uniref:DNA 5'-3' helicase n=1 Tax=Magnetococcus massalia (strain MO-1) TaxID=451514 RepID=A0A1S7LLP3_MAGMO|nr:putative ATP-dependent helicase [Candidatus Magnetococcus massalia]
MDALTPQMETLFGPESAMAKALQGYEPRAAQVRMAELVAEAVEEDSLLLVEAGTGTGKTLAYMLPLLAMGKKVVVSTATKALQDQILEKDIPLLRQIVGRPFSAALLKGRSNYLCPYRLRQLAAHRHALRGDTRRWFERIEAWSSQTVTGDRDELADLPERLDIWPELSTNGENCLGQECPDYLDCHLYKARGKAKDAQLAVVNHHLFFADLSVREGGFGEILPNYDVVVFDEAHQIPDVVTHFFGMEVSNYQLRELGHDLRRELEMVGLDDPELFHGLSRLEEVSAQLRSAFPMDNAKDALEPSHLEAEAGRALVACEQALLGLMEPLEPQLPRSAGLGACGRRLEKLLLAAGTIRTLDDPERVYWYETRGRGVFLQASPIHVGETLRQSLFPRLKCGIFTSATLATGQGEKGFAYFQNQLGMDPEQTTVEQLPPVFDYPEQARLYLPKRLPEPDAPRFSEMLVDELVDLIQASRGRALCLFTSYRMLNMVQQQLPERIPYPVLCQGERPKRALLEAFQTDEASVLLGTGTFWEGVDIPGESLSMVVIDRLPFASPGDPLVKARNRYCENQGQNPFMTLSIPQAILTLKQGVGRLLRRGTDRGVMAILDTRMSRRGYGKRFINGLPPATRITDLDDVFRFFNPDAPATYQQQPDEPEWVPQDIPPWLQSPPPYPGTE